MTRRELRENTFRTLFFKEFHELSEMEEQYVLYREVVASMTDKESEYVHNKVFDIISHLPQIDEAIEKVSEGWNVFRMSKVDLTIIRLAYYEAKYEEDVPVSVAINEAVEIAKIYGGDD